jgi:hypothetical protein
MGFKITGTPHLVSEVCGSLDGVSSGQQEQTSVKAAKVRVDQEQDRPTQSADIKVDQVTNR